MNILWGWRCKNSECGFVNRLVLDLYTPEGTELGKHICQGCGLEQHLTMVRGGADRLEGQPGNPEKRT